MQKNFKFIILLLVLSIVIFSAFNIGSLNNEVSENEYNSLVNDLSKVTTSFNTWISNKKEMLNTTKDVVDNFNYNELIKHKTNNPFLNINNNDPDVSQVYIGLTNGDFITGGQWIPPSDYDPRTRVWYQDATEADETIVSPVYIDRETGDQLVTISSPLYMNGGIVGVISADVFLNNISSYLKNLLVDDHIYTYLVDKEGTVIVHTNTPELVGQNLYTDIQSTILIDYFEQAQKTSDIIRMNYTFNDEKVQGITQNFSDDQWFLTVASLDESSILSLNSIQPSTLIFNLSIVSLILVLLYVIIRMKSELDKTNALLTLDNEKDYLTDIYNRRYFNLWMESIWTRSKDKTQIGLLMMDIDHFKEYNDTYGHIKGDEVLIKVARTINDLVRKGDIFARYGGEEFVLLLNDVTPEISMEIAEKLRNAIEELNILHQHSQYNHITLSFGVVSMMPNDSIDVRQFIHHADTALYTAKEDGRNKVHLSITTPTSG